MEEVEENWASPGKLEALTSSLRKLLRRGLNPAALLRAPRDDLTPVVAALGIGEADRAQAAMEVSRRLDEAIDAFGPDRQLGLRILLNLDNEEALTYRRYRASELFGLTPESFRKTRELQLMEELASHLLLEANRRGASPPIERPGTATVDAEEFTRRYCSAIELETRAIDIGMPEIRHSIDSYFLEPWVEVSATGESGRRVRSSALVEMFRRVVIVGDPGTGKTTLLRELARRMATSDRYVPFVVQARSFAESGMTLTEYLEALMRSDYQLVPPLGYLDQVIREDRSALFLDGLDELPSLATRRRFVRTIEQVAHRYPELQVFITTRKVGYSEASLDAATFARAELAPFDTSQQAEFISRWFEHVDPTGRRAQEIGALLQRNDQVSSLAATPLLLTLLCQLVAAAGHVPTDSSELLGQYVRLLGSDLDRARGIGGGRDLEPSVIESITGSIARYAAREHLSVLPEHVMLDVVSNAIIAGGIEAALARSQASDFLRFCRDRSWVVTEVGRDAGGEPLYGFTHLVFQEFFASSFSAGSGV